MYSIVIKNASIIDGSGAAPFRGDIAIEQDKIVRIANDITSSAQVTIDAEGMVLAPGFVDIQNHSDSHWQLLDNPALESMVAQGYTTILVGNSGASLAPVISPQSLLSLQKWHSLEGANINWQTFAEFADVMKQKKFGSNVASLVGYSTLRRGLVGDRTSALSISELESLKAMASQALDEGAFGISTGLSYAHETVISDIELFEIAKVVAQHKTLLSIHLRDEYEKIVDSLREVITIAQQSQANTKIAHLKIRHDSNWSLLPEVIDEIETANHQGTNIHFDTYPYTYTWQPLYSYLPTWVTQGGRKHILDTINNPDQRAKILQWLINAPAKISNFIIASTTNNIHVTGKRIGSIAADMGVSSEEAMLKIIENGGSEVLVFDETMSEAIAESLCSHPLGYIATNGSGYGMGNKKILVHPRCFGTAPKFLHNVIHKKNITLQEAIRKLTGGPATKIGLVKRGLIKENYFADIVVFSPEKIQDKATYTNPYQYPVGINYVLVNGQMAVNHGQLNTNLSGDFLTK